MNAILNAFFVLTRAQLVDKHPEDPDSEELGVQLTLFRTHPSPPDPIAEPLYEPPLVRPYLLPETEKGMVYGSPSSAVRGHLRGTSSDSTMTVDTTSTSTDVINVSPSPIMESSSS